MFGIEGKILKFNNKFRDLNFFNDPILLQEFIEYSKKIL